MQVIKNSIIVGAAGKPITVDIFCPESNEPVPVLIYAHGFNGFKDWGNFDRIAQLVVENGLALAKFNFSHNGTTPDEPEQFGDLEAFGQNNYSKQLADLKAVTDWVLSTHNPMRSRLDDQHLYLLGHSMGGTLAILFAAEDARIAKLVTWAAPAVCKTPWGNWTAQRMEEWKTIGVQFYTNSRTGQHMPLYYQLFQDYIANQERLDVEKAIRSLHIPVLLCHGTLDIAVTSESAEQLHAWQPAAELFLVESNHVFDRKHPWVLTSIPPAMKEVLEKTLQFLTQKTPVAAAGRG